MNAASRSRWSSGQARADWTLHVARPVVSGDSRNTRDHARTAIAVRAPRASAAGANHRGRAMVSSTASRAASCTAACAFVTRPVSLTSHELERLRLERLRPAIASVLGSPEIRKSRAPSQSSSSYPPAAVSGTSGRFFAGELGLALDQVSHAKPADQHEHCDGSDGDNRAERPVRVRDPQDRRRGCCKGERQCEECHTQQQNACGNPDDEKHDERPGDASSTSRRSGHRIMLPLSSASDTLRVLRRTSSSDATLE